ncbi:MAG: hypothetical protein FWF15_03475 [Oscillospiraceae bacterium]|nr:hypothetical protein [Oscillospiraceae bacterium]
MSESRNINPYKPAPLSFSFRNKNCREYGLIVNSYDFLLPEKRQRKQYIPFRHGAYDYSAEDNKRFYNERELRLRCIWMSQALQKLTRADIREIALWLSKRGRIVLDIEPDKYYMGELFDANELIAHYDYAINMNDEYDGGGTTDGEFEITFICEPFAYGKVVQQSITNGKNPIYYNGTADTPTMIVLRNNSGAAATNVQIVLTRKV